MMSGACVTPSLYNRVCTCYMQGPVTVAAASRVGRVIDIAWAPLPAPVGGGAVLLAATDDGGVAVLDACQASDAAPRRLRCIFLFSPRVAAVIFAPVVRTGGWTMYRPDTQHLSDAVHGLGPCGQTVATACRGIGLKAAVGGAWPLPAGGLAAPPPLGSAALLPPAWGLLLRLMIQQVTAWRLSSSQRL